MGETVQVEKQDRVATITLDRPPLNILDIATIGDLHAAIDEASRDISTDIILLRTTGEKAFSAGVDIGDHTPDKVPEMLGAFHGLIRLLLEIDAVSIAEVQAPAFGGGAELALACDLVVSSAEITFSFPEIDVGCFPPVALATLPLRVGPQRAAELVLTGSPITAEEAREMGLVNRAVPRDMLSVASEEIIQSLREKSPEVLRLTVKALRRAVAKGYLRRIDEAERTYLTDLVGLPDMQEGIRAFVEKRKPKWRGSE